MNVPTVLVDRPPAGVVRLSSTVIGVLLATGLLAVADRGEWYAEVSSIPFLAAGVVFCGLVPALVRRGQRLAGQPRPMVPYVPLVGIAYAVYFGLPGLVFDQTSALTDTVDAASIQGALTLSLLGLVALLAGYFGLGAVVPRPPAIRLDLCPERGRHLAGWCLAVGAVALAVRSQLASIGQVAALLSWLFEIGLGVLLVLALRRRLPGPWRTLLLVSTLGFLFLQVGSGSIARAILPAAALLMITWGTGRRVPLWLIVGGALLVVILRGNVDAFRGETWPSSDPDSVSLQNSNRFMSMLGDQFGSGEAHLGESLSQVMARVNYTVLFALVVERTPHEVPYWEGESYATLPASFVPRAFWPDKPRKNIGQEFGHRYGILAPDDQSTSINLPQLIEFFTNFGRTGVLVGMALLGLLYRLLDHILNAPGAGDGTLVLGAAIFSRLLNVESDFSLAYGAVPYYIVALWFVLSLARPVRHEGPA